MKLELRCPGCARRYLVDADKIPAGGAIRACQECGAPIEIRAPVRVAATAVRERTPRPMAVAPAPVHADTAAEQVVCPRCELHFTPSRGAAPVRASSRPRVLIVEDMDFFLEIAQRALEPHTDVVTARTVAEARRVLEGGGIDLLLLDLALEGEDGRELLRGLRGKPCPILVFTARDESDMYGSAWTELQGYGADDVVVKGMNMGDSLSRKVRLLLGLPSDEAAQR